MQIYLPVVEIPVDVTFILFIGLIAGFIGGFFGIGGGFISTPFLIFAGVPSAVAVATSANQIIASSTSGVFFHLKKGNVDVKMGLVLMIGGCIGTSVGMKIFNILQEIGQIDIAVSLIYIFFLGAIGIGMAIKNVKSMIENNYDINYEKNKENIFDKFHNKIQNLPLQVEFKKSGIKISLIVPFLLSMAIGVLVALMGVGGGFIMIPAMTSLLRMNSKVITGTSLFQMIFLASLATLFQSLNNNIDVALSMMVIIASAIGSQFGSKKGIKIGEDYVRIALAMVMLAVCAKIIFSLITEPSNIFNLELVK